MAEGEKICTLTLHSFLLPLRTIGEQGRAYVQFNETNFASLVNGKN
jgi:hypothetical protein